MAHGQPYANRPYDEHPDGWAIDWMLYRHDRDPELDWQVIVWIAENTTDEWSASNLAAGPLEDLIRAYGPSFIDRIETKARQLPRWRWLLSGVWPQGKRDSEVWKRIEVARGGAVGSEGSDGMPAV